MARKALHERRAWETDGVPGTAGRRHVHTAQGVPARESPGERLVRPDAGSRTGARTAIHRRPGALQHRPRRAVRWCGPVGDHSALDDRRGGGSTLAGRHRVGGRACWWKTILTLHSARTAPSSPRAGPGSVAASTSCSETSPTTRWGGRPHHRHPYARIHHPYDGGADVFLAPVRGTGPGARSACRLALPSPPRVSDPLGSPPPFGIVSTASTG